MSIGGYGRVSNPPARAGCHMTHRGACLAGASSAPFGSDRTKAKQARLPPHPTSARLHGEEEEEEEEEEGGEEEPVVPQRGRGRDLSHWATQNAGSKSSAAGGVS
ncbi:hypothetical protein EJ06DRAFT_526049 [Trichodelitschia bisporula]|uniref:Uncharacterized protein n=1 Tax=Trichodelitschia bisporula TaxID=703511 RepID=A0A6G1IBT5_9PEZI|nr:hypothetical protein EJ06DRAFT_526049 [Trichodelitschia bisporula]